MRAPKPPGIGLKPEHYPLVLEACAAGVRPGWVEIHPQNYSGEGGPPHRWLTQIAQHYPLSFHSVGLSLGSASGCDRSELDRLARLVDRYQPMLVSDHLSWSGIDGEYFPDLLPVPYTGAALLHLVREIDRVQNRLGRTILIENPSRYLAWEEDEMSETEFLALLCRHSGCGLLLDINNVEVSANNLGFCPEHYLDEIDTLQVDEVHLAGHSVEHHESGDLMIDDHGSPVSDKTWALFERFIARSGRRPVLIEWDTAIPPFERLLAEAAKAGAIMAGLDGEHARAA